MTPPQYPAKNSLVLFSGLPGSGKSMLAESVAQRLRLPLFSVDPIEAAVIKSGIKKSFETGLAAYLVAEALATEQFKLGSSVMIDAVNAEEEAKDVWRELAKKQNATLIIIECSTSDIALHKKRIESRVRNLHGMPEITWERVEERRRVYTPWKEQTLKIDTAGELEPSTNKAVRHIQECAQTGVPMANNELLNELDLFLKTYEQAANTRDFGNVSPLIADDAMFWFTDGEYKGKSAIRKAFEDTYASIQDETYTISDVKWIAVDQQVSVCMYRFRSNELVNRKRQVYAGKGTNVLKRINGNWQIIHEHLSKEKE